MKRTRKQFGRTHTLAAEMELSYQLLRQAGFTDGRLSQRIEGLIQQRDIAFERERLARDSIKKATIKTVMSDAEPVDSWAVLGPLVFAFAALLSIFILASIWPH